jgi:quercetin dioxygenase-like cupin family protein
LTDNHSISKLWVVEILSYEQLQSPRSTAQVFNGSEHDVDVSFFVNHAEPGKVVSRHRHPYPEVFVVQDGEATFTVEGDEVHASGGQIIVVPAGAAHGFRVTGDRTLEMVSIHPAAEMETEWLE